jgi:hypothetical protein
MFINVSAYFDLKMETVLSSETPVSHRTARRHIPEDSTLQEFKCVLQYENSYFPNALFFILALLGLLFSLGAGQYHVFILYIIKCLILLK